METEKRSSHLSDTIAFTWACNKTFHTTDPKIGFSMAVQVLKKLRLVSKEFTLYPEIGNGGSNIHFHGIIKLNDKVKWFKSVLPIFKRNGFVKIKPIKNDGWYEYIIKEWDIMKQILDLDTPVNNEYIEKVCTNDRLKKKNIIKTSQNIIDMVYGDNKGYESD